MNLANLVFNPQAVYFSMDPRSLLGLVVPVFWFAAKFGGAAIAKVAAGILVGVAVVSILTFRRIQAWVEARKNLFSNPNHVAFLIKEKLRTGDSTGYKWGVFDTVKNKEVDSETIIATSVDPEVEKVMKNQEAVVWRP